MSDGVWYKAVFESIGSVVWNVELLVVSISVLSVVLKYICSWYFSLAI
jgi:hypothetical protein